MYHGASAIFWWSEETFCVSMMSRSDCLRRASTAGEGEAITDGLPETATVSVGFVPSPPSRALPA